MHIIIELILKDLSIPAPYAHQDMGSIFRKFAIMLVRSGYRKNKCKIMLNKKGPMSDKTIRLVLVMMISSLFVAPPACAEGPENLTGHDDKYPSGNLYFAVEAPSVWKHTTDEARERVRSRLGPLDPLSISHNRDMGLRKGDTGIDDPEPMTPSWLDLGDFAISDRMASIYGKRLEHQGIFVGLRYSFSDFRFRDLRKSIDSFLKNFNAMPPQSVQSVSFYIAFPEF